MALQVRNLARLDVQQQGAIRERAAAIRRGEVGVRDPRAPRREDARARHRS